MPNDAPPTWDETQEEEPSWENTNPVESPPVRVSPYAQYRFEHPIGERMTPFGPENPSELLNLPIIPAIGRTIAGISEPAAQTTEAIPSRPDVLRAPTREEKEQLALYKATGIQPHIQTEVPQTFGQSVVEAGKNLLAPLETPEGIEQLGATIAAPEIMLPYFGFQGAKGFAEQAPEIFEPGKTLPQRFQSALESGVDLAMLRAAVPHYARAARILQATPEALRRGIQPTIERTPDALHRETETVLRDVQQSQVPQESAGQVPVDVGLQEAGARGGAVAKEAQVPLTPKQQAEEQARLAAELGQEEEAPAPEEPEVASGMTRLYHGEGGTESAGMGSLWYTKNKQRALSFGPDLSYVDVPEDVATKFEQDLRKTGQGTAGDVVLPDELVLQSKSLGRVEQPTFEIQEPSEGVERFKSEIEKPDFKAGNELSDAVGMQVKTVQDLDELARIRAEQTAKKDFLIEAISKEPDKAKQEQLLNQALVESQKGQLARETIETATNTGSHVEGEGLIPEKLGERPLDWSKNKEAADWLRKNGAKAGISLPEQLREQPAKEGIEVEVARVPDESEADRLVDQNVNQRRYKKVGNEFVVYEYQEPSNPTQPAARGLAASVRAKWASATEEAPLGSEAGFVNLDIIRDFVDKVSAGAKASYNFLKDVGKEAQTAERMTDYRRSIRGWSAKLQRSFGEAAAAQKEIQNKVPDSVRREGITNWIQAGGDQAVLQQRRNATESWRDPQGNPHPKQKQLLAGYDAALNLGPDEIQVAQDAMNAYGALGTRGESHGVIKNFKDNYVTQIWDLAEKGIKGFAPSARTLRDRFRFSKASTFPTFFDGEQAGYVPKTKDISKLLPVYIHEMNSVIAARQLVQQMSKGVASDGRPLVAPRGVGIPVTGEEGAATLISPKAIKGDTGDYRVLANQPALNGWRWTAKDTAGNPIFLKSDLAIHPEAFDRLRAVLGKSAIREWYSTKTSMAAQIPKILVKGLDRANQETKRTMLGLIAPFHQVQEATHAIGHRVNPLSNIPKVDLVNNAAQMDAAKHGLMMLPDRASENQFMEGFKTSGIVSKIPYVGQAADWYANQLFHQYIPGLKFKTYQAILDRNMRVYKADLAAGKIKAEDVKALSAEQTNAAYGHLNYADLGRNPTLQHLMQLTMLAPDFLEARARFAGQSIKGLTGAKVGREQLLALGTLALVQASVAYTAAKLTGGQWDAHRPFEFTKDKRRYTMRSVPEDISSLLHDTRLFVHSRLSPIIGKAGLQYLTGVDVFGRKVTAGETTKELLEQPLPISIRGFLGIGPGNLTGWENLAGAVGIKVSPYNPDEAKIRESVRKSEYADRLAREARKKPLMDRAAFINEQMKKDNVQPEDYGDVMKHLRTKGVFKFE